MIDSAYNVIVVGGGHAGCEAALAAARMGSRTLLVSMDLTKLAQMSCNPAIGGIAKGQIVREIDALGGGTGLVTDASTIQFRMLNRSKGPAMWSPRAQCDRMLFSANWRALLEKTPNLEFWQDEVVSLLFHGEQLSGVKTQMGMQFKADAVVITAGTFLNGKIFIGLQSADGGRIGEPRAHGLTEQLVSRGLIADRMKTGTPPRIDARSINLQSLQRQFGDEEAEKFSYLPIPSAIQKRGFQRSCYMVYTNEKVHDILRTGFDKSPLFTGRIHGKGPRYCPSIEDKLRTFADRDHHQLFLEPEGWNTQEYYLQGFSSSLPIETQYEALRNIQGFENVKIFRPAYAIEYDYFPPVQISHSLEVKAIPHLFFAGQINGTTGYEEAAAQGLMAGVNAHLSITGRPPFILERDRAYIGVLIDDLVTKGVDEPYRMFTSRAEYRILLRQDNADERLTAISNAIGLASEDRLAIYNAKRGFSENLKCFVETEAVNPEQINPMLEELDTQAILQKKKLAEILARPQVDLEHLKSFVPRGTIEEWEKILDAELQKFPFEENEETFTVVRENNETEISKAADLEWAPDGETEAKHIIQNRAMARKALLREIYESVEIAIKYKGYIQRERALADKLKRLEKLIIPDGFNYLGINSISTESRQKLERIRPTTIGQASRIPGVSPADISVLLLYLGR